jgi:hypothetical protein
VQGEHGLQQPGEALHLVEERCIGEAVSAALDAAVELVDVRVQAGARVTGRLFDRERRLPID